MDALGLVERLPDRRRPVQMAVPEIEALSSNSPDPAIHEADPSIMQTILTESMAEHHCFPLLSQPHAYQDR